MNYRKILTIITISLCLSGFLCCKGGIGDNDKENTIYTDKSPADSSMGYKILSKGKDLAGQVSASNYIYIVDFEFDLQSGTVNVGVDSVLKFTENGSIKNGTINFNSTFLDGSVNFKNMRFGGTLLNRTVKLSWFGANPDTESEKAAGIKNKDIIEDVFKCMGDTLIVDGFYPVSSLIKIDRSINLRSPDWNEKLCTKTYENSYEPTNGFYTTDGKGSLFTFYQYEEGGKTKTKGSINMFGIYLKGDPQRFLDATNYNTDDMTWGIFLPWGGSVAAVYNCKFEGFSQGIRALGGYIEKFQNVTFNACEIGLYALYASDFEVFSCKFTNCLPNYDLSKIDMNKSQSAIDNGLRQIGCGFMIEGCGMVNCANNLFENNFINLIINEAAIIINVSNNDFVNPLYTDIYVYNDYQSLRSGILSLGSADLQKYCIDNVVISDNNFRRNKNALGKCVVRFANGFHALYNHGSVEWSRVTNLIISNNTVLDSRGDAAADEAIFEVSNLKETKSKVTCSNNNFSSSKAKYFINLWQGSTGNYTFISKGNTFPSDVDETKIRNDTLGVIVCE